MVAVIDLKLATLNYFEHYFNPQPLQRQSDVVKPKHVRLHAMCLVPTLPIKLSMMYWNQDFIHYLLMHQTEVISKCFHLLFSISLTQVLAVVILFSFENFSLASKEFFGLSRTYWIYQWSKRICSPYIRKCMWSDEEIFIEISKLNKVTAPTTRMSIMVNITRCLRCWRITHRI